MTGTGRKALLFTVILFVWFVAEAYSLDESIYWGTWKGTAGKVKVELVIEEEKVVLKLNDKIIPVTEYDYVHSSVYSAYPFLTIFYVVPETVPYDYQKHYIYVVIGSNGDGLQLNLLRGFYEFSRIIDDNESLEIISYPLELRKEP